LRAALAKQFSTKDDLIMVRRIGTVFGDQVSLVEASVPAQATSLMMTASGAASAIRSAISLVAPCLLA